MREGRHSNYPRGDRLIAPRAWLVKEEDMTSGFIDGTVVQWQTAAALKTTVSYDWGMNVLTGNVEWLARMILFLLSWLLNNQEEKNFSLSLPLFLLTGLMISFPLQTIASLESCNQGFLLLLLCIIVMHARRGRKMFLFLSGTNCSRAIFRKLYHYTALALRHTCDKQGKPYAQDICQGVSWCCQACTFWAEQMYARNIISTWLPKMLSCSQIGPIESILILYHLLMFHAKA